MGVTVALLVQLLIVFAGVCGVRRCARALEGQQAASGLDFIVGGLVKALDGLELGDNGVFEELLEDLVLTQELDELGVVLLQLLYQIGLFEQLLQGEVGLVEDGVDGRDVGVAAEPPEHGCGSKLLRRARSVAGVETDEALREGRWPRRRERLSCGGCTQIPAVVGSSKYGPKQWPRQPGQRPPKALSKGLMKNKGEDKERVRSCLIEDAGGRASRHDDVRREDVSRFVS